MSINTTANVAVPWWKELTKDQWLAWVAAWLGWTPLVSVVVLLFGPETKCKVLVSDLTMVPEV